MPRDLPLGNGGFPVTFESSYRPRDVYYPFVGMEDRTVGEPCRSGAWVDGTFTWISDPTWEGRTAYEDDTLVGDTRLRDAALGLSRRCRDAVDFDRNVYFREVTVADESGRDRDVRIRGGLRDQLKRAGEVIA